MKISIDDLEVSVKALGELKSLKPRSTVGMQIGLIINSVEKHLNVFYGERNKLVKRLGEEREEKFGGGFWVPETSENHDEFTREYEDMLNTKVDVPIITKIVLPMKNSKDEEIDPSIGTLGALHWLFNIPSIEKDDRDVKELPNKDSI